MKASQVADVVATVVNKMSRDERKALRELLLVDGECFESVKIPGARAHYVSSGS